MSIANYSFLPWLRRGISNNITAPVNQLRAQVAVALTVNSTVLPETTVQLIGPGDIIGINSNIIIRTEPRNWITDFEPNYLAFIEFYDEDFPWRYTPDIPGSGHRLTPWLHLLVVKEDEFTRTTSTSRPLPSINLLADPELVFPVDSQTWAWAHVHVNSDIAASGSTPDNSSLDTLIESNNDIAVSRLFGPRKLEANTAYYAFLIPAFETGRKAGLGEDVVEDPADETFTDPLTRSWPLTNGALNEYPVYYEWFFRTGMNGDFEYLVGLLEARTMDPKVGVRDMDAHEPLFGLTDLSENAILGLEGALKAPDTVSRDFPDVNDATQFQQEIQEIINLQDDLVTAGNSATPVISPPFYGQWHAMVSRLNIDASDENWVNNLNKDPRNRTAAGMGTLVVQKKQESYMKTAWQQVGDILSANQKIRFAQLAMNAGQMIYSKHIVNLTMDANLLITTPVHPKVLGSPTTIYKQIQESIIPASAFSRAFRKLVRPAGTLMQGLGLSNTKNNRSILGLLNNKSISAAPPKQAPSNIINSDVIANKLSSNGTPLWASWILKNTWLFIIIVLVLLVFLFFITGNLLVVAGAAIFFIVIYLYAKKSSTAGTVSQSISAGNITTEYVASIEPVPSFILTTPGTPAAPSSSSVSPAVSALESTRFKNALLGFAGLLQQPVAQPAIKPAFDLANAQAKINFAINPMYAIPKRILPGIKIGELAIEKIVPVMAYPDIKQPMYEPLRDLSSELLIPNLNLIPQNTISLLETNQPFIEAYMTGLNHEFARELLWREYPTDQRGTSFRQFWDVSKYVNTEGLSEDELAEKLKDITPIHTWSKHSALGDHNNRETGGDDSQLVLVIRGDVLKKYPNTVIYAQKAKWEDDGNTLVINDSGTGEPDDTNMLYSAYSAAVNPDINFIGFDLTIEEARGDVKDETRAERERLGDNNLGWFFILKEIPGEPRFGLDAAETQAASDATSWDDLSWGHLDMDTTCINVEAMPQATVAGDIQWNTNSADMAYILYQKPVMIAVHAKDMLAST